MTGFRWTKFQDFYLRLGLLKLLVAVLDPGRRSCAQEWLCQRLIKPLLTPARAHHAVWERLAEERPWCVREAHRPKTLDKKRQQDRELTVAEALLALGDCPSTLLGVTSPKTAYKIIDWGRDLGFLLPGNQISEKGLLLRKLLPEAAAAGFLSGNVLAWNPFVLTAAERLFFLHHLFEVDELTVRLIDSLAEEPPEHALGSSEAAKVTCRSFFDLLKGAERRVPTRELPSLLEARRLAATIAKELDLNDHDLGAYAHLLLAQPPKAARISTKGGSQRRTTKNADHQTVPRCEQLVDLGFLSKPIPARAALEEQFAFRHVWRWQPTPACRAWSVCRRDHKEHAEPWEWRNFSRAATRASLAGATEASAPESLETVGQTLWKAYARVHRQIGPTPLYSVALMAMLEATLEGRVVEMATFHDLLLEIKARNLLPEHVFFASGNELDKMFIIFRPGVEEAFSAVVGTLPANNELHGLPSRRTQGGRA